MPLENPLWSNTHGRTATLSLSAVLSESGPASRSGVAKITRRVPVASLPLLAHSIPTHTHTPARVSTFKTCNSHHAIHAHVYTHRNKVDVSRTHARRTHTHTCPFKYSHMKVLHIHAAKLTLVQRHEPIHTRTIFAGRGCTLPPVQCIEFTRLERHDLLVTQLKAQTTQVCVVGHIHRKEPVHSVFLQHRQTHTHTHT